MCSLVCLLRRRTSPWALSRDSDSQNRANDHFCDETKIGKCENDTFSFAFLLCFGLVCFFKAQLSKKKSFTFFMTCFLSGLFFFTLVNFCFVQCQDSRCVTEETQIKGPTFDRNSFRFPFSFIPNHVSSDSSFPYFVE